MPVQLGRCSRYHKDEIRKLACETSDDRNCLDWKPSAGSGGIADQRARAHAPQAPASDSDAIHRATATSAGPLQAVARLLRVRSKQNMQQLGG